MKATTKILVLAALTGFGSVIAAPIDSDGRPSPVEDFLEYYEYGPRVPTITIIERDLSPRPTYGNYVSDPVSNIVPTPTPVLDYLWYPIPTPHFPPKFGKYPGVNYGFYPDPPPDIPDGPDGPIFNPNAPIEKRGVEAGNAGGKAKRLSITEYPPVSEEKRGLVVDGTDKDQLMPVPPGFLQCYDSYIRDLSLSHNDIVKRCAKVKRSIIGVGKREEEMLPEEPGYLQCYAAYGRDLSLSHEEIVKRCAKV